MPDTLCENYFTRSFSPQCSHTVSSDSICRCPAEADTDFNGFPLKVIRQSAVSVMKKGTKVPAVCHDRGFPRSARNNYHTDVREKCNSQRRFNASSCFPLLMSVFSRVKGVRDALFSLTMSWIQEKLWLPDIRGGGSVSLSSPRGGKQGSWKQHK